MWCYLLSACSRIVPHVCWSYPGVTLFTSCWPRICSPRVHENQIRRINQRVVHPRLSLTSKVLPHVLPIARGFLSIIMESMSGLLIPCLSGLQIDRPYPHNARSMLEVKFYNSIHPDFFWLQYIIPWSSQFKFHLPISSQLKLANRPFLPQSTRKPPSPGPGNRLQRQPGDPAGARLRHRGSQALGRSQVLGWDKAAWVDWESNMIQFGLVPSMKNHRFLLVSDKKLIQNVILIIIWDS